MTNRRDNFSMGDYIERFWSKVDKSGECWVWTAARTTRGYGQFHSRLGFKQYKSTLAHRVAWEMANGPVPTGMQLDHLCRNRPCVRASHLEAVTLQENLSRGMGAVVTRARFQSQTHCKRGHELSAANVYIIPTTGSRQCRACRRERAAA